MHNPHYAELAELAGGFIHEIKNHLSTLNLNLQLLSEEFEGPQSPRERKALERVERLRGECARLVDVANDFLRFARLKTLERQPADLAAVVDDMVSFFAPTAMKDRIEVKSYVPAGLPEVPLDVPLFKQALLNLLLNAQQAMPEGGEITLQGAAENGEVVLHVIDTGRGMSEETLRKAFKPFYSTRPGGTGLGLPTAKKIIEAHGGSMAVESAPRRGTRFTIRLPAHDGEAPAASPICLLDGQRVPLNEAKVSVLDRGFVFGDGIYEVVPVYDRKLFRFEEHLARLGRSLAKLRIDNPHTREQWLERCRKLIAALFEHGGAADQLVYIQVTRGVAMRDHVMPLGIAPTVFMMTSPMKPASGEQRHQGVACVSARDFRWERGDIKSISLLGNVMARQISYDRDALETIMFRNGFLTEAAASNVWVVHEGAVLGPPKSEHVLEGIRYELIRELCEECGIAYNLRPIAEGEVNAADEILLSSATKEILPVTTLDGEAVGHGALRGKPGPVYARLYEAYQRAKQTQSI
jgi:D-alanine transaminase